MDDRAEIVLSSTINKNPIFRGFRHAFDVVGHTLHHSLRAGSLPFWCLCIVGGGIAGVLVDLDHIPRWLFDITWLPVPFNFFHFRTGRSLHPALFLLGCGLFACAGGLLVLMVLNDIRTASQSQQNLSQKYIPVAARSMRSGVAMKPATMTVEDDNTSSSTKLKNRKSRKQKQKRKGNKK
jgi:hypothetical protein